MLKVHKPDERRNPGPNGLKKVGPGLYSLPDELAVRPAEFTEEYKDFTRRMRALGNPLAYIRAILKH